MIYDGQIICGVSWSICWFGEDFWYCTSWNLMFCFEGWSGVIELSTFVFLTGVRNSSLRSASALRFTEEGELFGGISNLDGTAPSFGRFDEVNMNSSASKCCQHIETPPQHSQNFQLPILRANTKICLSNAIVLKFGEDHHNDKRNFSCKFHQNPSWGRSFPPLVVPFRSAKFQKVPSPSWILMKFAGKVSFIIVMILSKFQDDFLLI